MRLPRQIVRHFHKGPHASRAHTDFDYLDRGSDRVVTMWIPIGDCPMRTGGLAYLSGSHRLPKRRLDVLKRLVRDEAFYADESRKALEAAKLHDLDRNVDRFLEAVLPLIRGGEVTDGNRGRFPSVR